MKTKTTAAIAAQQIRKELKINFPGIKFKVHSKTYSGGNSINISFIDGPEKSKVEDIVCKFKAGHFDGMTDCYDYSNTREDIPQVNYVFVDREFSYSSAEKLVKKINSEFGYDIKINKTENGYREYLIEDKFLGNGLYARDIFYQESKNYNQI